MNTLRVLDKLRAERGGDAVDQALFDYGLAMRGLSIAGGSPRTSRRTPLTATPPRQNDPMTGRPRPYAGLPVVPPVLHLTDPREATGDYRLPKVPVRHGGRSGPLRPMAGLGD